MEVILREHVDNVGRRGEIVKVADGYARNYLLPRKLALLATEGNKQRIERALRKQLSALRIQVNGPPDDAENAQRELYRELLAIYKKDDLTSNLEKLSESEDRICFILYRLNHRDDKAIKVALCLLDLFPHRTIHAATYLARFIEDPSVVWKLVEIASTSIYSEARIHCMEALTNQIGFVEEIAELLQAWCKPEQGWQLRYEALNWLRHTADQFDFAWEIAQRDDHLHVRARALQLSFEQAHTIAQRIEVINFCLASKHSYLQALGLFLWRREARISRQQLRLESLPTNYEPLFLAQDVLDAAANFRKNLALVFGIGISPSFPLTGVFEDIVAANQHILDIQDAETNRNKTVLALYELVSSVLVYNETDQNLSVAGKTLVEVAQGLDENTKAHIERLSGFRLMIRAGGRISPKDRDSLQRDMGDVLRESFEALHRKSGLSMSSTESSNANKRTEVFISYSHKDKRWMERLRTMLKPAEANRKITVWADTNLRTGVKWHEEIQAALQRAKVGVLLVTMNFLASDYIRQHEFAPILEAAKSGGMTIFWVAVGSCLYEETYLKDYQCANDPQRPLENLSPANRDKVLKEVAQKLIAAWNSYSSFQVG